MSEEAYFYDGKGNLIKQGRGDESGALLDYQLYTYDDYGNILSSEYYYGDIPVGEAPLASYYTWVLQ